MSSGRRSGDAVQDYVSGLLSKYQLDGFKIMFQQPLYSRHNIPSDFDHIIAPLKVSKETKRIKTGKPWYRLIYILSMCFEDLAGIARNPKLVKITPINIGKLNELCRLHL